MIVDKLEIKIKSLTGFIPYCQNNTSGWTIDQPPTWPEASVGGVEGALEQCAIRSLFCLLLFHRCFSVDLSHQIVENLQDRFWCVTGARVQSELGSLGSFHHRSHLVNIDL